MNIEENTVRSFIYLGLPFVPAILAIIYYVASRWSRIRKMQLRTALRTAIMRAVTDGNDFFWFSVFLCYGFVVFLLNMVLPFIFSSVLEHEGITDLPTMGLAISYFNLESVLLLIYSLYLLCIIVDEVFRWGLALTLHILPNSPRLVKLHDAIYPTTENMVEQAQNSDVHMHIHQNCVDRTKLLEKIRSMRVPAYQLAQIEKGDDMLAAMIRGQNTTLGAMELEVITGTLDAPMGDE